MLQTKEYLYQQRRTHRVETMPLLSLLSEKVHFTLDKVVSAEGKHPHKNHRATQHLCRKNLFHLKHLHTISHEEHGE